MKIDSLPMQVMMSIMRRLVRGNLDKTHQALKRVLEATTS